MFDGEGSGDSSATTSTGSNTANAPQNTSSTQKVIYGKQVEESEADPDEPSEGPNAQDDGNKTIPDRKESFARFKDEFKDLYGAEVESIIKGRFKKYTGIEQQLAQQIPIIESLIEQHGTNDLSKLLDIVQENTLGDLADKEGLTIEQAKEIVKLKNENKRFKNKFQTEEQEQIINQRVAQWYKESDVLKQTYSDFSLQEWANNAQFMGLLEANIDVKTAYEICNLNNIKAKTAKEVEKSVIENIKVKGIRPTENGLNQTPGVIIKSKVEEFTRKDRAEIARRVAMGEKIVL